MNSAQDSYCDHCLNENIGAEICDKSKYLCMCPRVKETRSALKDILFPFIVSYPRSISDLDLLTVNFCCREADMDISKIC